MSAPGRGGPQVNKFEQVSSDDYQMSKRGLGDVPCLMSKGSKGEGPMSDVQGGIVAGVRGIRCLISKWTGLGRGPRTVR